MFMSAITQELSGHVFPDLAGARVLVTGVTKDCGVDVARAFAEHKTRLILQCPEASPEMTELGAVLAEEAAEVEIFCAPMNNGNDAVQLTQRAVKVYGGIDAVVNVVRVPPGDMTGIAAYFEVEQFVSNKLLAPTLVTRVAANRMRLTMTEGSILNVIVMPPPAGEREQALAGVLRSALAALTRGEAQEWAREGIRINAIGPRTSDGERTPGAVLTSGPDIAVLALHLASKKGKQLSGYLFDAESTAA